MRRWFLAALVLSGCGGDVQVEEIDAFVLSIGVVAPMNWYVITAFADGSCPAATVVDDTTTTLTGDCTDASGSVWTGTATLVTGGDGSLDITYDSFGSASANMSSVLTGQLQRTAAGALVANLEMAWDPGTGVPIVFGYTGYGVDDIDGYFQVAINGTGSAVLSGQLTQTEGSAWSVSGSFASEAACASEIDEGTVTLSSDDALDDVVLTWDGAQSCDGCGSWTQGERSGTLCQ